MWPHRRQPTSLPYPWDSLGKNTGVGCHFLLQCMKVKSESEVAQSCPTLCDPMDCSLPGSSSMGFSRQEYWSGVPVPSPSTSCSGGLFTRDAGNWLSLVVQWPSHVCLFATPWTTPGPSVHGVGCHFLLQGIFSGQGSNPHFLHWWVDCLTLSHQESPERLWLLVCKTQSLNFLWEARIVLLFKENFYEYRSKGWAKSGAEECH